MKIWEECWEESGLQLKQLALKYFQAELINK